MHKIVKIAIISLIGILSCYILGLSFGGLVIGGLTRPAINEKKMVKIFENDIDLLETVKEFLIKIEYDNIYIPDSIMSEEMSIKGKKEKINDSSVCRVIDELKIRGYEVIGKDNHTIYFQRWSNLDAGRGIVFSTNGNEPELQFLTKLVKIEDNWYYYETDFNEWKVQN